MDGFFVVVGCSFENLDRSGRIVNFYLLYNQFFKH